MMITEVKVKGDTDKVYTVAAQADGSVTCECLAYRFRKHPDDLCKHQLFVVGLLLGEGASLVPA